MMRMPTLAVMIMAAALPGAAAGSAQEAQPTSARLLSRASVPLAPPLALGGGEVILDLTIGRDGAVMKVTPVRATPPYTDLLSGAVKGWRFEPAQERKEGTLQQTEGHVLLVAVYRPPQVYAAPAQGAETKQVGQLAPDLPQPGALGMPTAYPPRATRDGAVLVEIELSSAGMATGHRVMSPSTPFDAAALETVKAWRFGIPAQPSGAEKLYVYAVVGFREPVTQ